MKIAVIGQGYVGLPLSMAAAKSGHQVIGIDMDKKLVASLNSGFSPIFDISNDEIASNSKNYKVTSDYKELNGAEIIAICVPTPLDSNQKPDNSFLINALKSVAENMDENSLVIIESTIAPGTTRGLAQNILNESGKKFELAYSPERIDPANMNWNIINTPKLIAGLSESATQKASNFYRTFIKEVIMGESVETFETAKLLENTFRLINISFINEFAEFCSILDIDVREVIKAAQTKPYGFMPFYPSAGVGGHCIPVDPIFLSAKAKEVGAPTKFIELANQVNNSLGDYFVQIAKKQLGGLQDKKIILVGVAYKPDISDTRETPAKRILVALRAEGAIVDWHDELVGEWNGEISSELSANFDLAILVNPHSNTNLSKLANVKILDVRGGY